ncbi:MULTISPECIES: LysR family transcriptional regulator [Limibacillus]|jgi:DNA-binding transcriptional LysR family regulator|uniref:DNA-binding transcriptional LysR family regulator n=1 Tax=Limibacillus halophilus TaxID=1579333 RepID=A0A839SSK7_9PROT|nr:LysR family transcriptional regulator [Limibacillus halophilus]MBB3065308.1 DNA-binding transcriptional LysR family regulator [Limibacillus halophilus]
MDWDKLRIFHAVAEAGSFTHAGDQLNLSQSAVSRQISALEDSLNVTLFHRHARGLILTEQGELLYRTAHEIFGKLSMVEAQLAESKDRPRGALKITTTVAFGSTWLAPRMREFIELYPDIETHLILADRELDLSMREADVAIRLSPPRQADLVQRHLLTVHINIYASPHYLKKSSSPASAKDLDKHRLVVYGEDARPPVPDVNWLLRIGNDSGQLRKPALTVNNVYGVMRAVQAGAGLGALPEFMAQGSSDLVQVLPELTGPTIDAYFVYPEELRSSKRIQVFRDFLLRHVTAQRF